MSGPGLLRGLSLVRSLKAMYCNGNLVFILDAYTVRRPLQLPFILTDASRFLLKLDLCAGASQCSVILPVIYEQGQPPVERGPALTHSGLLFRSVAVCSNDPAYSISRSGGQHDRKCVDVKSS